MAAQLSRGQSGRWVALAGLALAVGSGDAAGEARPRYGGRVVATLLGRPASLDPVLARSHAEATVAGLVFDTLYALDDAGAPIAHLAAALPEVSADGKEARIALVAGVVFHDGRALAAADVASSLERTRKLAPGLLAPLASARADGDAVVLTLRRAAPELAVLLAAPQAAVTPGGRAPGSPPVGSGPFVLAAIDERGRELRLVANPAHFAGRPYLDALALRWFVEDDAEARAYESGTLDMSLRGAVAFAGHQPKNPTEVTASTSTVLVYVGFGTAHRAAGDRDVRRALSLALGRGGLVGVGSGEEVAPTSAPLPVDIGGTAGPTAADPDGARRALAAATARLGALGATGFELLIDRSRPDDREVGEKVVAALYRLGLGATIRALEPAEFADRVGRGACDFYIGHLALATLDPGAAWALAFAAGGDVWAGRQLAAAPADLAALAAGFAERLPIVPLLHRAIRVHHRAELRRVELDLAGRIGHADVFLGRGGGR